MEYRNYSGTAEKQQTGAGRFYYQFHISLFPRVPIMLKMTNCFVPAWDRTRSSLHSKLWPSSLEYKHFGDALQGRKDEREPSAIMKEVNLSASCPAKTETEDLN